MTIRELTAIIKAKIAFLVEESECEVPEASKDVLKGKILGLREILKIINSRSEPRIKDPGTTSFEEELVELCNQVVGEIDSEWMFGGISDVLGTSDLKIFEEQVRGFKPELLRLAKEEIERESTIKDTDEDAFCKENCKGYQDTGGLCFCDGRCEAYRNHQKSRESLPETTGKCSDEICMMSYNAGMANFREQILKDSVIFHDEMSMCFNNGVPTGLCPYDVWWKSEEVQKKFKDGDKVKIIVSKE